MVYEYPETVVSIGVVRSLIILNSIIVIVVSGRTLIIIYATRKGESDGWNNQP